MQTPTTYTICTHTHLRDDVLDTLMVRDIVGVLVGLAPTLGVMDVVRVLDGAVPVSLKHSNDPDGHSDVPPAYE